MLPAIAARLVQAPHAIYLQLQAAESRSGTDECFHSDMLLLNDMNFVSCDDNELRVTTLSSMQLDCCLLTATNST